MLNLFYEEHCFTKFKRHREVGNKIMLLTIIWSSFSSNIYIYMWCSERNIITAKHRYEPFKRRSKRWNRNCEEMQMIARWKYHFLVKLFTGGRKSESANRVRKLSFPRKFIQVWLYLSLIVPTIADGCFIITVRVPVRNPSHSEKSYTKHLVGMSFKNLILGFIILFIHGMVRSNMF